MSTRDVSVNNLKRKIARSFQGPQESTHRRLVSNRSQHPVPAPIRDGYLQVNAAYRARIAVGGAHNWPYFDPMMRWAMPQIIELLTG